MKKNTIKIKICGITNQEDAQLAVQLGTYAIGFIFYDKSPRRVDIETAKQIIKTVPKSLIKVGVFVNASLTRIKHVLHHCSLQMIQLHGDESPEFCKALHQDTPELDDVKIIKAFPIKILSDIKKIKAYRAYIDYILLDTKSDNAYGGTGKSFDWKIAKKAHDYHIPMFLSGGISSENVIEAIETVHPEVIDLSSSIEEKPGKKDPVKLNAFFNDLNRKYL